MADKGYKIELASPIELGVIAGDKFIKELIYEGSYLHPDDPDIKIEVTVEKMQEWVNNFAKKLIDIPFVPIAHPKEPGDNVNNNTGDVLRLWIADSPTHPGKKSLFAELLIKIKEVAEKIGKTIKGCSVGIVGVTSPETGEYLGEALEHVALTNRPYITNLADYQAVGFSKIPLFVFERKNDKDEEKKINHKEVNMADAIEFEKKLAEMQKANEDMIKNLTAKFEADKKAAVEVEAKKVAELEKSGFLAEVTNEIDKLELSGKIVPAEKAEKLAFAKKLTRELFTEYIADLQKAEVKVKTGTQMSRQESTQTGAPAPLVSEIAEWGKQAFSGKIKPAEFQKKLDDWNKRYEAAGMNFEKKGSQIVNLENPTHQYIAL